MQQFLTTVNPFFDFYRIFGTRNGLLGPRNPDTPDGKFSRASPGVDGFKIGLNGRILWPKTCGDIFPFSGHFLL